MHGAYVRQVRWGRFDGFALGSYPAHREPGHETWLAWYPSRAPGTRLETIGSLEPPLKDFIYRVAEFGCSFAPCAVHEGAARNVRISGSRRRDERTRVDT